MALVCARVDSCCCCCAVHSSLQQIDNKFPLLSPTAASASLQRWWWCCFGFALREIPLIAFSACWSRWEELSLSPSVRFLIDHPEEQQQQRSSTVYTLIEIYCGWVRGRPSRFAVILFQYILALCAPYVNTLSLSLSLSSLFPSSNKAEGGREKEREKTHNLFFLWKKNKDAPLVSSLATASMSCLYLFCSSSTSVCVG